MQATWQSPTWSESLPGHSVLSSLHSPRQDALAANPPSTLTLNKVRLCQGVCENRWRDAGVTALSAYSRTPFSTLATRTDNSLYVWCGSRCVGKIVVE